jgi:hypothetical protein
VGDGNHFRISTSPGLDLEGEEGERLLIEEPLGRRVVEGDLLDF